MRYHVTVGDVTLEVEIDREGIRVDGEWKFQQLKLTSHFWTPFDEGWAMTQFV